jgi:hypothetical protein
LNFTNKLSKENNRLIREKSPNLVTLALLEESNVPDLTQTNIMDSVTGIWQFGKFYLKTFDPSWERRYDFFYFAKILP